MQKKRIKFFIVIVYLALVAAGCSSAQPGGPAVTAPPAGNQTDAPALPSEVGTEAPGLPAAPATESPTTAPTQPGVDTTAGQLRFELVPEESEARYRVTEQLAGVSLPSDAIGRTRAVTGAVVIQADGSIDPAQSRFEVDLSSLQSDEGRRDNFLRRNTLQTDQFPTAVFVPKQVDGLPADLPVSGEASFRLLGDLTIREVTRPVEWQVSAQVDGARVSGQAVTSFTFADFELQQPRVPVVLSVEDTINLEVDFTLVSEGRAAQAAPETTQVVALPATGCTPPANPTPPMTEGPYYTPGSPERASLLEEGVVGERLVITGFVLTVECEPVAGALLDFWQTDGQGVYDNSGYRLRGHQFTDESGAYRLETVVPGEYPGRTQHIHVKVQAPGGEVLTTQLFLPGAPSNETDSIFSPELVMQLQETADGAQGSFNFILEN